MSETEIEPQLKKIRVCEAVEDIDDPHGTRVWEVCAVDIEPRPHGRYFWRGGDTLSTHATWREAQDAAMDLCRCLRQEDAA